MESTRPNEDTGSKKNQDRIERLHKLHLLRTTARKMNHAEVIAEDARKNLPANFEARQRQADWLSANEKGKAEAAAKGLDYDRIKMLSVTALEAESIDKKKRKKYVNDGFADFESQTARQYNRLVKQFTTPDMDKYQKARKDVGDDIFYGAAHSISQGWHKDKPKAIDNMVNDLEQQIMKRKSFSRRRKFDDESDIDYINEKNARFNKKLERFYGEYTAEIKQNLERGTAI